MKVILLADDASFMRNDFEAIIKKRFNDITINHFEDGKSIFEYYKEMQKHNQKPDAIILDHTMPAMSGIEACRRILEIDPIAPIIAFTGEPEPFQIFYQMGIKKHIHKPIIEAQVIDTLNLYLR